MVVAGIAIDNVEILNLVEVVFGSIGGEDACYAWVETASQDGAQSGFFKAFAVSPLPRVLEVSLVFWLVVGSVEIVAATCQASVHDGEVLIRQCKVDHEFRFEVIE